ncbi:MAG: alginate lyase family protein [Anaerolineales bacterium]|nr:alginate lyase family protein [Anaerolineales bacterium]
MLTKLRRYLLTISRMSRLQIYWRIRRVLLQQMWRRRPPIHPPVRSHDLLNSALPTWGYTPRKSHTAKIVAQADQLVKHTFTFLNQTHHFSSHPIDWSYTPDGDPLWTYNLHYFEYSLELLWAFKLTNQKSYLSTLNQLIEHWIDHNPFWDAVAWNAYPLSKRVMHWCMLLGPLHQIDEFRTLLPKLQASLGQQAEFLAENLEYDVDNNHLITNGRALVWLGIYLSNHPDAAQWYQKGLTILENEAQRQVLPDGGHYERSSSYQGVVLQDFLETIMLQQAANKPVSPILRTTCVKMCEYIYHMLRPDGRLPLLNDSVDGYPLPTADLLAICAVKLQLPYLTNSIQAEIGPYADWLLDGDAYKQLDKLPSQAEATTSHAYPDSGYFVLRDEDTYLLFDCGEVGPTHSAAHAHADTLNIELFAAGQAIFVDPGVYEYQSGSWRNLFRSTKMHNTVTVDELDQSVMWASFRVAEMARPELLEWVASETITRVSGKHDGYARLNDQIVHKRTVTFEKPNRFVITDVMTSKGREPHQYDLWFHLGPTCIAVESAEKSVVCQFEGGLQVNIEPQHIPQTTFKVDRGWYSSSWKQKEEIYTICFSSVTSVLEITLNTIVTINLPDH